MSTRIGAAEFQQEVLAAEGIVVVDFYSDSCLPCKRMTAVLSKVEAANPQVKFVKVNIKYEKELAARYHVMSTPTLLYFKSGTAADKQTGAVTQVQIQEKLEELL